MAETTDGAMHFEASLDNRKLLGAIDETIRRINGLSDATVKGGAAMDASFSQMAAEIKQRFNKVDNTIDQHLHHIGELKKEYEAIGRTNVFASKSLERGGRLTERQVAIREEVKAHQALVEELGKEAQKLAESESKLKQHQEQVERNAAAHNSLRSRIRELKEEMGGLIDRGINEQSAAYRALADELGRLQDIQGDVAQQGRILSNDEAGFQGLIAGVSGLGGRDVPLCGGERPAATRHGQGAGGYGYCHRYAASGTDAEQRQRLPARHAKQAQEVVGGDHRKSNRRKAGGGCGNGCKHGRP